MQAHRSRFGAGFGNMILGAGSLVLAIAALLLLRQLGGEGSREAATLPAAVAADDAHAQASRVERERQAVEVLKRIKPAQEAFRREHGRYATLRDLAYAQLWDGPWDGESHPASGYRFYCEPAWEAYTVVAMPPGGSWHTYWVTQAGRVTSSP